MIGDIASMPAPTDTFGRHVTYLRISIMRRCNLRCAYCMPETMPHMFPDGDMLTLKQIAKLAEIYTRMGVRKVRITGGEPLIRKGVARLISDLKSIKGIHEVTMTTNGVLLSRKIPALKDAGLDRINISMDTLNPWKMKEITGHDVFEKVMGGILEITSGEIWPVKINVVAINGVNDDEILDFARLAFDLPLEVRFIEMMPTSHNLYWKNKSFIPAGEIEKRIRGKYALTPLENRAMAGPAVVYGLAGGAGKVGFVSPMSRHFCDNCNRMRLTAEGKLRSCLFDEGEIDLKRGLLNNEDDDWFIRRFAESLSCKPRQHMLDPTSGPSTFKPMVAIGG